MWEARRRLVVPWDLRALRPVTQLYSFPVGRWTGTPASPRGTAGLRCRCSTVTPTSSFRSAAWAPTALQVGVSGGRFWIAPSSYGSLGSENQQG